MIPAGAPSQPPNPRRSRSMTDSPPWVGGIMVASLLVPAIILITYTLVPLPGQERLGSGNYIFAGAVFATNILLPRMLRRARRPRRAPHRAHPGP